MTKTATKTKADKVAELKEALAVFSEDLDDEQRALLTAEIQGYSERNAMLIAMQCPGATEVHGFKDWMSRGRCVRKGEKGIQILAPAGKIEENKETGDKEKMFFRIAFIFDISQTDPK